MAKYRVFISYWSGEREFAKRIADHISGDDIEVLWDQSLSEGGKFSEQLRSFISHAHVFLPILTKESNSRGWIHQEIGYALARNIAMFPVTIGTEPTGIIAQFQANNIGSYDSDLKEELLLEKVLDFAKTTGTPDRHLFECGTERQGRAELLSEAANEVLQAKCSGMVRQRGGFSSFAIPDAPADDPIWDERYGWKIEGYKGKGSVIELESLRQERVQLEQNARKAGCKLIIRTDTQFDAKNGPESRPSRIRTLLDFLDAEERHEQTYAVIDRSKGDFISQLLVGTWFLADSLTPDMELGFRQTTLCRDAHFVQKKADDFDKTFKRLLQKEGWGLEECREKVIEELRDEL